MTNTTCRGVRELLSAFHDNELPCETSYSIQEHLEVCDGCRAFSRLEDGLSHVLRARVARPEVPDGLFERARARWRDPVVPAVPEAVPASSTTRSRAWQLAYVAAAAVLAVVLFAPVVEMILPGTIPGMVDFRPVKRVEGTLVCYECARLGVPVEEHANCHAQGHHTGLNCDETGLWHFVASEASQSLMSDPSLRGQPVVVEGRFLEDIRYVDASSITLAN